MEMEKTSLHKGLAQIVSSGRILDSNRIAERATSFWNRAPMQAEALVMPTSVAEVSSVLKYCNQLNRGVLTHGGLTNCVAGVEPEPTDIVLSTEKLSDIVDIDKAGGTATVEAGAILEVVQQSTADEGLYFPLDLGARGSCTIGGNIATNAGGMNVLRYGMMRNLVLGLETVLADGTVVSSLNRMLKNNAGYDTKQLFIGSEGTLGVVTRAVLRLYPLPRSRQHAFAGLAGFEQVVELLGYLQSELAGSLSAFEVMWNDYYRAVTGDGGHRPPLGNRHPYYVVFQAEGSDPAVDNDRFERVIGHALDKALIADAVLPKSESEVRAIWAVREDFDSILERKPVYLFDVSLPIREMPGYVDKVLALLRQRWPDSRMYTLGHIADGNLHFFIRPGVHGDHYDAAGKCVYDPLRSIGGSVSAEHGIGTEKLAWLPHSRSEADIDLMRQLKRALDPNNTLNPNRVL